jgi:diaminopimelate epimerase
MGVVRALLAKFAVSAIRLLFMTFYKYHGTGNDFVMLDDRQNQFDVTDQARIAHLCNRRFGIGADGLILLRNRAGYDFEMVYFNADGRPSSMCGNGGRCTVAFAKFLSVIDQQANFLAVDGPHEARVEADGTVRLKMIDVDAAQPAPVHEELGDVYLHTGSPHHIRFLDPTEGHALAEFDVYAAGHDIRFDQAYDPAGVNVNFVEAPADPAQPWAVRTYERGVEGETYSCGTGVTAVALAAASHGAQSPVQLSTPGGALEVSFDARADGGFANVWLSGPAVQVFSGEIVS